MEYIVPGFAAFAVTRFGTRAVATQIAKWKPSWAKHAGAAASVSTFLAAWLLAHRVKFLAKYQAPLMVGSGIAAIQSLIQLYVPMLGWAVSDATPELAAGTQQQSVSLPPGIQPVDDDPNLYTYNDSYDPGSYAAAQPGPTQQTNSASGQQQPAQPGSSADEDLLADLDLDDMQTAGAGGIFAQA